MHRIIVGHDGSEGADRAVELVAALALPPDTPVSLVTAIPDVRAMRSTWGRLILGPPGPIEQQLAAQATRALEDVAERARQVGLQATTTVVVGRPAAALAAEGERSGATIIAIGSRRLGRIRSGMMSSASAELVRISARSVLVARAGSIERIVLATDGSEQAKRAEEFLTRLPVARQVPVTIMTVAAPRDRTLVGVAVDRDGVVEEPARVTSVGGSHPEEVADAAAKRLAAHGIYARVNVPIERASGEVRGAKGRRDLIVLGWAGRSVPTHGFEALLRKALYGSPASLLIVR